MDPNKPRKGPGRPCSPERLRRSERVVTMVTSEELAKLKILAAARAQSISSTVHNLIERGLAPAQQTRNPKQQS